MVPALLCSCPQSSLVPPPPGLVLKCCLDQGQGQLCGVLRLQWGQLTSFQNDPVASSPNCFMWRGEGLKGISQQRSARVSTPLLLLLGLCLPAPLPPGPATLCSLVEAQGLLSQGLPPMKRGLVLQNATASEGLAGSPQALDIKVFLGSCPY